MAWTFFGFIVLLILTIVIIASSPQQHSNVKPLPPGYSYPAPAIDNQSTEITPSEFQKLQERNQARITQDRLERERLARVAAANAEILRKQQEYAVKRAACAHYPCVIH